jgi:hypothetical protein
VQKLTRRSFAKLCGAAAAANGLFGSRVFAAPSTPAPAFKRDVLGKIAPRPSKTIAASPLSVGFETLDRKMFLPERTYTWLGQLGVKWARCQTGWARTEQAKGVFDFAWLDGVVDSLRDVGVQPWFNLGYGNRLYTPDAPDASAVGWVPSNSDEAQAAWIRYTGQIAEHFRDRVKHWEIWNEPNIRNFWKPTEPTPEGYVALVKRTAPEIRKRISDAVIIGGAFAGMPLKYFQQCMELGLGEYVDKISYHPYRPIPEAKYEDEVRAWREVLAKYKPSLQLWQGENGCPSEPGGSGALANLKWTEATQARWLTRRILNDLRLGIEVTSYFHTVDMVNYNWGSGPSGKTNFKGLLRGTDYTPKPAYSAYQCLAALFDAQTTRAEQTLTFAPAAGDAQPLDLAKLASAGFRRNGYALCAYWWPSKLPEDFASRSIRLTVNGAKLDQPVLIDPLTSEICRIEGVRQGDTWTFAQLPLVDYPLLLTDRALG